MKHQHWISFIGLVAFALGCSAAPEEGNTAGSSDRGAVAADPSEELENDQSGLEIAHQPRKTGQETSSGESDPGFLAAPTMLEAPFHADNGGGIAGPADLRSPGEQIVRIFYATDRLPIVKVASQGAQSLYYLATGVAAFVTVLAGLAAILLPKRLVTVPITSVGLVGTLVFCQMALVEAQQRRRVTEHGDRSYSGGRHERNGIPVLELGACEVSIPPDHRVGRVESPSILKFEFREDPQNHVILERVVRLSDGEFYGQLENVIARSQSRQAFVFIHGYNVGFEDAVKRTAQIAYDLKFDGAAICYSWPSFGGFARYTQDEANIAWTVTQLEAFLRDLSRQVGTSTIHLIAHSMGNRAMTQALERLALRGNAPRFGQVILAAPDVDTSEFRTRYAPTLLGVAERVTLYASSNDRALLASTRVHGYTRAGLSGDHLSIIPGLETVGRFTIDTSLIGHSYYGDNPLMIRDLVAVIHRGLPADGREWLKRNLVSTEAIYWAFRPELLSERSEALSRE